MPLAFLDHVSVAFGYLPVLDDVSFQIETGERVAVIGRNGTGKSTLLQVVGGELVPDRGTTWRQPGVQSARLVQDAALASDKPVFDLVSEGLGEIGDLAAVYHHTAVAVADGGDAALLDRLGRLQHELDERDGWRLKQRVELVLSRLSLPSEAIVNTLSGGWKRRVLLARALVGEPQLLLLDEPTNHLDIDAIGWLENFLADYAGAVVFVTHDRTFLQKVATRVVDLDRGRLTSWPGDYATFLEKKEAWLANETLAQEKFDKRLAEEEAWLRQGVKARRTRNEGRVKALLAMREERASRRTQDGGVHLQIDRFDPSGRTVFEADRVTKAFGGAPVVDAFSARVVRGDRIGLIGPNGVGKTTLLRLLIGELEPDSGEIRRGANIQVAYYDQQREQLDPDRTVFDTIGDGNDMVTVNGRTRHVHGYLRDFLFPPERARSPVRALSGGERNRLLLARLFTRPANVLVLDEPTNDLDLETLELLEATLVEWPGTLLLVSHDRAFLDNVVTSTFVFEGNGRVREYVGGYQDWVRQRQLEAASGPGAQEALSAPSAQSAATPAVPGKRRGSTAREGGRLSYNEQRELERLPALIETLEGEEQRLNAEMAHPEFYKERPEAIARVIARLEQLQVELPTAYARWDELDSRAPSGQSGGAARPA